jgi:hypothetical protein
MSQGSLRPSLSKSVVIEIVINAALPYIIYRSLVGRLNEWPALILASVPPLLYGLREFVLRHRVDTIGALALASILFRLISLLLGGSARALLLRGSVITGLFGVFYLASLFFVRPLIFYIVRFLETGDKPEGITAWNELWATSVKFRYGVRVLTIGWGIGLLVEAWLGFAFLQVLTIEQFLLISPFLGYGFNFGLIFWSLWYGNRMKQAQ